MRLRRSALAASAALALLLAAAPRPVEAVRTLRRLPDAAAVTDPLVAAVALSAWALAAWLLLTALLTAGSRLGGPLGAACGTALRRSAPVALRRAVAVALGVGVVLGSAGSATAAGAAAPPDRTGRAATVASLDWPGAVPAVPTPAPSAGPHTPAGPALDWPGTVRGEGDIVVVAPGDTLWGLAAERLPSNATDADIAAAWPAWWSANRAVIGDDPDLLHPGQRLQPPHS